MIPPRMSRPIRVLLISSASAAVAAFAVACGTQKISVPTSDATAHAGAVLFSQRCSGCHTLSYAATGARRRMSGPGRSRTVRTSMFAASGRSRACCTRFRTEASPARSCPRTLSSVIKREPSRSSSPSTRAGRRRRSPDSRPATHSRSARCLRRLRRRPRRARARPLRRARPRPRRPRPPRTAAPRTIRRRSRSSEAGGRREGSCSTSD